MADTVYPQSLDSIFSASGVGSLDKALTNTIYGLDYQQNRAMTKSNRDQQGYVFMTRPQLNLQKDNLRNYRELYPLLDEDPNSLAKAVRMLLDPRLGAGYNYKMGSDLVKIPPIHSNIIDNQMAFIPMITNLATTVSGFPDLVMQTDSSDPGLFKQVYVLPTGVAKNYEEYDVTITTKNISGDPLSMMLYTWLHYMSAIRAEATMSPYYDAILNDRIDYQTRIYRVILNESKTKVTKIFASIAGFPVNSPTGMFADYNSETPFSEQTKEIPIRIKCMGFVAYDPLLIYHFNKTVGIFKPEMREGNIERYMHLLRREELPYYRWRAYPRINPENMNMEWWVDAS